MDLYRFFAFEPRWLYGVKKTKEHPMKTMFLLVCWLAVAAWSCSQSTHSTSPEGDAQRDIKNEYPPEEYWPDDIPDHHNSRISIDYFGTYRGVVPCADCEGIETVITLLEGDEFERRTRYLGKNDDTWYREAGPFEWDVTGGIIELATDRDPRYYRVGENVLIQLDINAEPITGDTADLYRLYMDETH